MAGKNSFATILQHLAPQSTGKQPISLSVPLMWYAAGQFYAVALVFGGEGVKTDFTPKNRNAGKLLGIAVYQPERKVGAYLTPDEAFAKYGIEIRPFMKGRRPSAKALAEDDKTTKKARLKTNFAERFFKNRLAMVDYNHQIELAAQNDLAHAKMIEYFKLDPDFVPAYPRARRRLIGFLIWICSALIVAFLILSRSITNYYYENANLKEENQNLRTQVQSYMDEQQNQEAMKFIAVEGYNSAEIISANQHNGYIADHVIGNQKSKVIMAIYYDYQCPYSAEFHSAINDVIDEYQDRVVFVQRHFPLSFHLNARAAARAVEAASKQGYYWQMSNAVLEKQSKWSGKSATTVDTALEKIFQQVAPGGDIEQYRKDRDSDDVLAKINFDMSIGSLIDGNDHTPGFFINGHEVDLDGVQSVEDLGVRTRSALNEALEK